MFSLEGPRGGGLSLTASLQCGAAESRFHVVYVSVSTLLLNNLLFVKGGLWSRVCPGRGSRWPACHLPIPSLPLPVSAR